MLGRLVLRHFSLTHPPYVVLGIPPSATLDEAKAAYKTLGKP